MVSISEPLSPEFARIERDGMVWAVRDGFQALTSGSRTRWVALRTESAAALVKTGDHRTVWRVSDPKHGALFVKLFDAPGLAGRLRARIAGSPARREANALKEAERRGIPAVLVIAVGDCRTDGSSVLITREQPNAHPLPIAWDEARGLPDSSASRARRRGILKCTAKLLAESRQKGLVHLDGHPGNILVARGVEGNPSAAYVDLARCAWAKGPAPERRQIEAMAQLYQYAFDKTTRSDRLRFVRECVRGGQPDGAVDRLQERRLIRSVERSRARTVDRLACHRDRRLRRDGKYFHRIWLEDGWRGVVVTTLERRHRFPEPDEPDRSIDQWRRDLGPLMVEGESQGTSPRIFEHGPWLIRLVNAANFMDALRWTIGGSPARRAFERCHRLRHRDGQASLVLGYLERRGKGAGRVGLVRQALSIENRAGCGQNGEPS